MNAWKPFAAAVLVGAVAGAFVLAGRPTHAATPWDNAPAAKPPVSVTPQAYSCSVKPVVTPEQSSTPSRRVPGEFIVTFTNASSASLSWEKVTYELCAPGNCLDPVTASVGPLTPGATDAVKVGNTTPANGGIFVAVTTCEVTRAVPATN